MTEPESGRFVLTLGAREDGGDAPVRTYEHRVDPMTVGELRHALEGLADDTVLRVSVPDEPSSFDAVSYENTFVLTGARFLEWTLPTGEQHREEHLTLAVDYPSGVYEDRLNGAQVSE
ncbi:DUF6225 family protein [Streptomyces sp. NPDC087440]|uniref:DUF6225 family protein n=1 Tax=Streptomyces sp. NPDC087440 TaxID=3365790 RepID=UPI00382A51A4